MGKQTAGIQQTMQQGNGMGSIAGQFNPPQSNQQQFDATNYYAENPDVAKAYQENNYGMGTEQFAKTHYQKYGMAEGRAGSIQQSQMPDFQYGQGDTFTPQPYYSQNNGLTAQPNSKGASTVNSYPHPQGMQGSYTNSATSGQPQMGQPNIYPNTVGMRDNSINTSNSGGAKGKGA
jgi:hypothetical protein